jgi:pSer/pThr/pTyr-binding forkhead associated (FHA) protein
VICSTCGHANPDRLTFCEECGQRLGPRVAPPTPPIGVVPSVVSTAPLAPSTPAPIDAVSSYPPGARPAVPPFTFTAHPPVVESVVPPEVAPCVRCGQPNQRGLRFCVSCGKSLLPPPPAAPTPAPLVTPPPPQQGRAFLQTHAMQDAPVRPQLTPAITPSRVVGVGGADAPKTTFRVCPRCRGACDSAAQFCRFCGASLSTEGAPPVAPVAAAPFVAPVTVTPPPAALPRAAPPVVAPPPIAPPVPSSGPKTDPAPPPAMSSPELVIPSAPFAPPIDGSDYRAFQSLSEATSLPTRRAPPLTPGRIVLIARDGGEGAQFPLGETTDIGRLEGQILLADDRYIAPRHARLSWRSGTLYLRDLETPNGLYLRLAPHHDSAASSAAATVPMSGSAEIGVTLRDQDLFLVGQQVLRFEVVNDAVEGFGAASQHGTLLFGTPASPRYARLCQRTVEGVTRDVFYLRKVETVLGRELGDIVFTEDPFLSRRHAALRVDVATRAFTLVDLGSSNGTFLQIRDEVALRSGDQFRIGQQLFRVDVDATARS